jgi:hypothetical protein
LYKYGTNRDKAADRDFYNRAAVDPKGYSRLACIFAGWIILKG